MSESKLTEHVIKKAGRENLIDELVTGLSHSELNTLLLALAREMAGRTTPSQVLRRYCSNRFVKPSALDPLKVKRIELVMLEAAAAAGITPVLLSPASLLGSCSVFARVDQNNVVSAVRGLELLSDSTNLLAIYLADGIRQKTIDRTEGPVHLCSCCRVTRGQMPPSDKLVPHFGLFSMVSCGRDTGSYGFEREAAVRHLGFYADYFSGRLGKDIEIVLNPRGGYKDKDGFIERMRDHLRAAFPGRRITVSQREDGSEYYQGFNFKVVVEGIEIVDGGLVDWTQKLLGSKKERLLISGAGIDLQLITGIVSEVPSKE